jgi:hypothetical protein
MKTSSAAAPASKASLLARLKVAQKKAEDSKKSAKAAKADLRHAKKFYKQARKTAKAAKKVVKELKTEIAAIPPARKRRPAKPVAPSVARTAPESEVLIAPAMEAPLPPAV